MWTLEHESDVDNTRSGNIVGAEGQGTGLGKCTQERVRRPEWTESKFVEGVAGDKTEMQMAQS